MKWPWRRRAPKPTGLDDRGAPFTFEGEEFHANVREGVLKPWSEHIWMWAGGAFLVFLFVKALLDPKPFWPLPAGWWMSAIFGLLGGSLARFSGQAPRHDPIRSATALAFGFCGSCGYALRELPIDADGCRKCTECGSSWHNDRLVMADRSKQALFDRLEKLGGYHLSTMPLTDDRGSLLAEPYGWPSRRTRSLLPPLPVRPDPALSRESLPALHRRQLIVIAAAIWAAWAAILAVYFFTAGDLRDSWSVVAIATLVALLVTFVSRGISLRTAVVRRVLLASGECPGCAAPLTTPFSQRVQFDRGIECHCATRHGRRPMSASPHRLLLRLECQLRSYPCSDGRTSNSHARCPPPPGHASRSAIAARHGCTPDGLRARRLAY